MNRSAYDEMFEIEDKHWWYLGLHDLIMVILDRFLPNRPLRVLDVGCGTGGLMSIMAKSGHQVDGVDVSPDALAYCRKRGLRTLIRADLNDWTPEPDCYDVITCIDVLYHAWIRNDVKILKSLAYGLKGNGRGVLVINNPAFAILTRAHDRVVMGNRRYTSGMIRSILSLAGLLPILVTYRLPHAFLPLLLKRLLELRRGGESINSDIGQVSRSNGLLYAINRLENRMIENGLFWSFGSSLFVVAVECKKNHLDGANF